MFCFVILQFTSAKNVSVHGTGQLTLTTNLGMLGPELKVIQLCVILCEQNPPVLIVLYMSLNLPYSLTVGYYYNFILT